jgi:phosphatidylethanolamine/phosphatidyl-N-methylethanolamine N-methyltransferase
LPPAIDRLSAVWHFFLNAFRDWDQTASFIPSSRYLIDEMVAGVTGPGTRAVVELGTGTGGVTEALLAALPADARLYAVEIDGPLLAATARRLPDPRLVPIHGSAADLESLLPAAGHHGPVDAVVSSLGMSLLPPDLRDSIVASSIAALKPGGVFVQFGYLHSKVVVYSPIRGWSRFDLAAYLEQNFDRIRKRRVLANFPPADVFVCRRLDVGVDARADA